MLNNQYFQHENFINSETVYQNNQENHQLNSLQ